ncbi:MAG: polysaccharide deacetylase family protein [Burkholderiales bacterium]
MKRYNFRHRAGYSASLHVNLIMEMHSNTPPPVAPGEGSQTAAKHFRLPLWLATPALQLSAGLHFICAVLTALDPAIWKWTLGAIIANHVLILATVVMWPRSRLLGPNMIRLPAAAALRGEVALTFDDGPDPIVTPQVLDLLDRYGAKASFFCIADKAIAHPELTREIIRRGHSVENHTNSHPHTFPFFGPNAMHREIDLAQNAIYATTGIAPIFFRAPMGFRNPFLAPVVERAGLRYVNWTRRGFDTFAKSAEPVLKRLQRGLAAGDILLLHDSCSIRPHGGSPVILEVLPRLLEHLQILNLRSVALHSACGHAGKL